MTTGAFEMQVEFVKDRLRKDYREAVGTLIAAGLRDRDAEITAMEALRAILAEAVKEFNDEHTRSFI